jgi:hypothetical protein
MEARLVGYGGGQIRGSCIAVPGTGECGAGRPQSQGNTVKDCPTIRPVSVGCSQGSSSDEPKKVIVGPRGSTTPKRFDGRSPDSKANVLPLPKLSPAPQPVTVGLTYSYYRQRVMDGLRLERCWGKDTLSTGFRGAPRAMDRYLWIVGMYMKWKNEHVRRTPQINVELRGLFEHPSNKQKVLLRNLLPNSIRTEWDS